MMMMMMVMVTTMMMVMVMMKMMMMMMMLCRKSSLGESPKRPASFRYLSGTHPNVKNGETLKK